MKLTNHTMLFLFQLLLGSPLSGINNRDVTTTNIIHSQLSGLGYRQVAKHPLRPFLLSVCLSVCSYRRYHVGLSSRIFQLLGLNLPCSDNQYRHL